MLLNVFDFAYELGCSPGCLSIPCQRGKPPSRASNTSCVRDWTRAREASTPVLHLQENFQIKAFAEKEGPNKEAHSTPSPTVGATTGRNGIL